MKNTYLGEKADLAALHCKVKYLFTQFTNLIKKIEYKFGMQCFRLCWQDLD